MADLEDGETTQVKGSGSAMYELKNVGGVYSCSCPAWRNQGVPHFQRTCKHLKAYRGAEVEAQRLTSVGASSPPERVPRVTATGEVEGPEPPLLLAHPWDNQQDLTGWWMSEKLDGVRAFWDGERIVSRKGNAFFAPEWFRARLPKVPLDGELWAGRKQFQRCVSIVRSGGESQRWKDISYVVFDSPGMGGSFEERTDKLRELLAQAEGATLHPHTRCEGVDHLRAELRRIEELGGEGLMLRQPGSRYEAGRSWTLLKVKSFFDAEARVVGHQAGAGRHEGRLGALLVQLENGTRFAVGTGFSDAERRNPPAIGSWITFRYQELTDAGVPRFPSYVGERFDLPEPKPSSPPVPADLPLLEQLRAGLARARELTRPQDLKQLRVLLEELENLIPRRSPS